MLTINIDGASRGNPGNSGIGIIIFDSTGSKIKEYKEYIGIKTNNQAEYFALKKALQLAAELSVEVTILSDSELVVNQRNNKYKVRNNHLKEISREISNLEERFKIIKYRHIPRAKNAMADKLANQAIDEHIKYQFF